MKKEDCPEVRVHFTNGTPGSNRIAGGEENGKQCDYREACGQDASDQSCAQHQHGGQEDRYVRDQPTGASADGIF